MLLPAGVMDDMERVPWHEFHLVHDEQPAAISVNNIRSCKYSQVLLMIDENIARNM